MSTRSRVAGLVLALTVLMTFGAGPMVQAQPQKSPSPQPQPAQTAKPGKSGGTQTSPQMSQKEMDRVMALATPGPNHKKLARLVGTWKTTIRMWTGPGEPAVSNGKATYEWILGGRYLKSTHTGEFGGMPFEGLGIDGYDNAKKEYFSTWFDNMGTGVIMLTGHPTADGNGITYTGTTFDASQMKDVRVREMVRMESDTRYVFEMYMQLPEAGKKAQLKEVMEIVGEKQ